MSPFLRYLLFQLPGWSVAAAIAAGLYSAFGVPGRIALGMVALLIALDFVLYPFFRHSYSARTQTGVESLIGELCAVETALAPRGYVRIRGERWQARVADVGERAEPGETVQVLAVRGLTLVVTPSRPA